MRRLIRNNIKPVYGALQSQMMSAAAYVRANGLRDPTVETFVINSNLTQAVINLYTEAAILAKKKYRSSKRFGGGDDFISRVLSYLKNYILDKVVRPINNTTAKIIRDVINNAIQNGWGVEKTAKYLETTDITKVRARMIIRTESVRATNYTQMTQADNETFVVTKQWIAIEDKRTRVTHSHAGVDGEVRNLDGTFSNGLAYPGDPNGSAQETINCRCTMGYKYARDANGKLIPKNPT